MQSSNSNIKVNIYGDSIMAGAVMEAPLEYITIMKENIDRFCGQYPLTIHNRARFGITVDLGRRMLERDLAKGLDCDYALIEFGGNDSNFNWAEVAKAPDVNHYPRTDIDTFRAILASMVQDVRSQGTTPVLMTLPPIDGALYFDFIVSQGNDRDSVLRWLGDANMIYRFHEMYSGAVRQVAEETRCLLVDARAPFLSRRDFHTMICKDGLHLNRKGHEVLFGAFSAFVEEELHRLGRGGNKAQPSGNSASATVCA